MLPLPRFEHHSPRTLREAVALVGQHGNDARLIAGGTDLVPNMKHGLFEPEHLISLGQIDELVGIAVVDNSLVIGAMTRLCDIAEHSAVLRHAPALAQACGQVGGPHHRRMGTVGGNICLDTRCVYYNQTYFWREALGFCLKKDGSACHVVTSGKRCVAAASNDSGPALMVLEGEVELLGSAGTRRLSINEFYNTDGIYNLNKTPNEIVTQVRIPLVAKRRSAFEKLRRRGAIDYPLLNCAVSVDLVDGAIEHMDLVVSALAARPKRVKLATRVSPGTKPSLALWDELADAAFKQCKPLSNLDNDADWRREMVRILVRKALATATQASAS